MKLRLVIILATTSSIYCIPDVKCNRLKIGNNWYDREVLLTDLGRPYNLNIHRGTNTLFFSYTLPETYSDVDFQLAYYNLDSKNYETIAGIRGGCAIAIDEGNDEVYLGGSNGIFKYNVFTKLADTYKEGGVNIWTLFHRKNLFYVSYPDQKLHIEIDGKFAPVLEFSKMEIDHFFINNNNIIYFANKTGLYKYNYGIEIVNHLITVRQITEDVDGNVYICSNFGIFVDKKDGLEKVLDMKNIYGIAFDRDNRFVLSDEKSIMKLRNSKFGCMNITVEKW